MQLKVCFCGGLVVLSLLGMVSLEPLILHCNTPHSGSPCPDFSQHLLPPSETCFIYLCIYFVFPSRMFLHKSKECTYYKCTFQMYISESCWTDIPVKVTCYQDTEHFPLPPPKLQPSSTPPLRNPHPHPRQPLIAEISTCSIYFCVPSP